MITPTEKTAIGKTWSAEIITLEDDKSALVITGKQKDDGWTVALSLKVILGSLPMRVISRLRAFSAIILCDSDGRFGIVQKGAQGEWDSINWTQCADLQDALTAATGQKEAV